MAYVCRSVDYDLIQQGINIIRRLQTYSFIRLGLCLCREITRVVV